MSTKPTAEEKSTGKPFQRGTADYIRYGTDTDGAHHVYAVATDTVHVVHDDGTRSTFALEDTPLGHWSEWFDHVEHKRGWDTPHIGNYALAGLAGGR